MIVKRLAPGDDLCDAYEVRGEVFVEEQGFSADTEMDDTDAVAHHVVLYDGKRPIAASRTFPDAQDARCYIIGRVAVRKEHRGDGAGKVLMQETEALAADLGAESFSLGAQLQASGFYEKCGYRAYGEHYYDEHCEHVHMKKEL